MSSRDYELIPNRYMHVIISMYARNRRKGKESQEPACRSEPGQENDRVWGEIMNRYPTDVLFHGFTTSGPAQSSSAGERKRRSKKRETVEVDRGTGKLTAKNYQIFIFSKNATSLYLKIDTVVASISSCDNLFHKEMADTVKKWSL